MGRLFRLKPTALRVNTGHRLARDLVLCFFFDNPQGNGNFIRNLAPPARVSGQVYKPSDFDMYYTPGSVGSNGNQQYSRNTGVTGTQFRQLNFGINGEPSFRTGLPNTGGVFTGHMRICAWETSSYGCLFDQNGDTGWYLRSSGVRTMYFSGDHNSSSAIATGADNRHFSDISVVSDSANSTGTHYLNGEADGTFNPASMTSFTPDRFANDAQGNRLPAFFDCALLWYRALPAAEIAEISFDPYALLEPTRRWWIMGSSASAGGGSAKNAAQHYYRQARGA